MDLINPKVFINENLLVDLSNPGVFLTDDPGGHVFTHKTSPYRPYIVLSVYASNREKSEIVRYLVLREFFPVELVEMILSYTSFGVKCEMTIDYEFNYPNIKVVFKMTEMIQME